VPLVVACVGRIRSNDFLVVFHLPSDPFMIMAKSESSHMGPRRFLSGGGDNRGGLEGLGGDLLLSSGRGGGGRLNLDGRGNGLSGGLGGLGLGLGLGGRESGDSRGLLNLLDLLGLALALLIG